MQVNSEQGSVVITQEMPIVEAAEEKSSLNRLGKFVKKVAQKEWISELDLFSVPLKLNFNGEDTFKTEFGGLVYLLVGVCSIVLTVITQFPDGIQLNAPINFYGLQYDAGNTQTVFDHSNNFFKAYLADKTTNQRLKGSDFTTYLQNISIWNVVEGVPKMLETQVDAATGTIFFNYSPKNAKATIYGYQNASPKKYSPKATLQLQYTTCALVTLEANCVNFYYSLPSYYLYIQVDNYLEGDGGIINERHQVLGTGEGAGDIYFDRGEYTTNNKFFGFMANVFSYKLNYYTFTETPLFNYADTQAQGTNCPDPSEYYNACYKVGFKTSGSTSIVTQQFDDVTVPILFFLSVSQTIFYIVYLLFLKNYANNSLRLRIADSLVYICQPDGRHYNFKSGFSVFLACLLHNHALMQLIDKALYLLCQSEYKRCLPLRAQLAMDMIDYGEDCLDEGEFFGEINEIYSQENVQPVKIIVDLEEEEAEEEKVEEPEFYFEDDTKEEAFRRMCQEHEFYSPQKRLYLKQLLEETEKKFKLVVITQQIFEKYRRRVEEENHTKEIELPIRFADDELSGHDLKKENFN